MNDQEIRTAVLAIIDAEIEKYKGCSPWPRDASGKRIPNPPLTDEQELLFEDARERGILPLLIGPSKQGQQNKRELP